MENTLSSNIHELQLLAVNVDKLANFNNKNNPMEHYAKIIKLIESIKHGFSNIFIESCSRFSFNIDPSEPTDNEIYAQNVETKAPQPIANSEAPQPIINSEVANSEVKILQMENEADSIIERRRAAHKLKDMEHIPMLNALHRYTNDDQNMIIQKIFAKAKHNVENVMGIDVSDPSYTEYLNTEADCLLESWLAANT